MKLLVGGNKIKILTFEYSLGNTEVAVTPFVHSRERLEISVSREHGASFQNYYRNDTDRTNIELIDGKDHFEFSGRWMSILQKDNVLKVVFQVIHNHCGFTVLPPKTAILQYEMQHHEGQPYPEVIIIFRYSPQLWRYFMTGYYRTKLQRNRIESKTISISEVEFKIKNFRLDGEWIFMSGEVREVVMRETNERIQFPSTLRVPVDDEALEYYRENWGFNPHSWKSNNRTGQKSHPYMYLGEFYSLGGALDSIEIAALVIFDKNLSSSNKLVFRKKTSHLYMHAPTYTEEFVDCVHTAIMNIPGDEKIVPDQIEERVYTTEGRSIGDTIPPWEHFLALRSYARGIVEIGLQEMITLSYHPTGDGEIDTIAERSPVGFNAMMQSQIITAIRKIDPGACNHLVRNFVIDLAERSPVEWFTSRYNYLDSRYGITKLLVNEWDTVKAIVEHVGWIVPLRKVIAQSIKISFDVLKFTDDDIVRFMEFYEEFNAKYGTKIKRKVIEDNRYNPW